MFVARVQQTRLLDAATAVVAQGGVARLTARTVSARAGMSTKTFYDLFANSEDCLLAVFDRAVEDLAAAVLPAWKAQDEWVERVRGALGVLLACLDRDAGLARVVFVEALAGGPRVLARRAEVLDRVAGFIDEGREGSRVGGELLGDPGRSALTAAGVAGAAFGLIHARLLEGKREGSLMELLNPLVATVVLPYRGHEASARELERAAPELPELPEGRVSSVRPGPAESSGAGEDSSPGSQGRDARLIASVRPTRRTYAVLAAVAEFGGANNRLVGERAGICDEAQMSRMLARLERHGLVVNRGAETVGLANAWWLTGAGEEFLRIGHATCPANTPPAKQSAPGGKRGAKHRREHQRQAA